MKTSQSSLGGDGGEGIGVGCCEVRGQSRLKAESLLVDRGLEDRLFRKAAVNLCRSGETKGAREVATRPSRPWQALHSFFQQLLGSISFTWTLEQILHDCIVLHWSSYNSPSPFFWIQGLM